MPKLYQEDKQRITKLSVIANSYGPVMCEIVIDICQIFILFWYLLLKHNFILFENDKHAERVDKDKKCKM